MGYALQSKKGMTLVETVIAVAILGVLLAAVFVMFLPALRATGESNEIARARAVSDSIIDYMRGEMMYSSTVRLGADGTGSAGYLYVNDGKLVQGRDGSIVPNEGYYSDLRVVNLTFTPALNNNVTISFQMAQRRSGEVLYDASYTVELLNMSAPVQGDSGQSAAYDGEYTPLSS